MPFVVLSQLPNLTNAGELRIVPRAMKVGAVNIGVMNRFEAV